jgi:hypothetical protein
MTWSDIPRSPTSRALRQFAAAWLVFFLAFGAHQYLVRGHHTVGVVVATLAVVFGGLGLARPAAVRWLFITWMVLAFPIGWAISQIMLAVMFYLLLTPVAILFRFQGRDPLARKPAPNRDSFWDPKPAPQDVRSYFRQY